MMMFRLLVPTIFCLYVSAPLGSFARTNNENHAGECHFLHAHFLGHGLECYFANLTLHLPSGIG